MTHSHSTGWPEGDTDTLRLWTSRYQSRDAILASGAAPVRITRGNPRFKLGYRINHTLMDLAPPKEIFKADLAPEAFDAAYSAHLARLGVEHIERQLRAIAAQAGAHDLVLLCFEDVVGKGEHCHRTTFARWWQEQTGQPVPEFVLPAGVAVPEPPQQMPLGL